MTHPNELMPTLAVPVLRTPFLARLTAFYQEVFGFELVQQVPGVVSVLRQGPVRLQLWQYARGDRDGRVLLSADACIFALHAGLARRGRAFLREHAPQLKCWGCWEFSLIDIDGNCLVFAQGAVDRVSRDAVADGQSLSLRKPS
jgi:catechol 2,3-dioxygenase-like lactoylglutathione lyase family enzyme